MVLSENLDENSFCAVVETKEILEQVEVKKKKVKISISKMRID